MAKDVIVRTSRDRIKQLLDGNRDELKLDVISPGVAPTKLADVDYGMNVDIAGIVRQVDSKHEFERKDGTPGQVRGIRIQDATADLRCALWGEWADEDLSLGDPVLIRNARIEDGWEDDIEASVGYSQDIEVLEQLEIEFVTIRVRGDDGISDTVEQEPADGPESVVTPSDDDASDDPATEDEADEEQTADDEEDASDSDEDKPEENEDEQSDDSGNSSRRFDITRGNQ